MATKVHMEALSPTMEEGQLVRWLKSEGDTIEEGDVLAEIETDKATMELVARGSGVLQGVRIKEGETAPVGEVIAIIGAEGDVAEEAADDEAAGDEAADEAADDDAADDDAADDDAADDGKDAEAGAEAKRPERQEQKTPEAKGAGAAGRDQDAKPREVREKDGAAGAGKGAAQESKAGAPAAPRESGDEARVKVSPLARRLAEESGIDLSGVEGTGPGGRVTKRDIEAVVERGGAGRDEAARGEAEAAAAPPVARGAEAAAPAEPGADSTEVPVTQMRKAIARRLAQSIGPIPTFYLTVELDMTEMMALRGRLNERLEKSGGKASLNDFIIKAVAVALARHPEVNASWGDRAIIRHSRVHVGVAVAVEDGLITPIIRDADRKRVRDIATEVKELAERAREKKLKPEEYTGATFSISNLGMFGIVEFTAIINPPEAGILAVGAVEEKPVVVNGEVVVQPRMRMTMSCDHRVVDGAMGARFLQTVRELMEDPMLMIA
jgi:pyruvate dehydrogenase E2 component (dihydrolipoamide acetyltransferase)